MPPQQHEVPSWEELRKRAVDILRSGPARGWEPADWEDMAQEAVLKTIGAMAKGQVDMQRPFDSWFYTVVRNVARDWHSLHSRDVPLPEAHEPEDTQVDTEINQLLAGHDVEGLLALLEPRERLVLTLNYWHDLTSSEIAEILGEGVSAS